MRRFLFHPVYILPAAAMLLLYSIGGDSALYHEFMSLVVEHRVDLFLTQISVSFIAITITSVLSSKDELVYWANLVEEILVYPKHSSFESVTDYCFFSVIGSFVCVIIKEPIALLVFFAFNIISLATLAYKMLTIYFDKDKLKKRLQREFDKRYSEAEREKKIEKLVDNTYRLLKENDSEKVVENIKFMLDRKQELKTVKMWMLLNTENEAVFIPLFRSLTTAAAEMTPYEGLSTSKERVLARYSIDESLREVFMSADDKNPVISLVIKEQERVISNDSSRYYLSMAYKIAQRQILDIFDERLHSEELRRAFLDFVLAYDRNMHASRVLSYENYTLLSILHELAVSGNVKGIRFIGDYLFEHGNGNIFFSQVGRENDRFFINVNIKYNEEYRVYREFDCPEIYQSRELMDSMQAVYDIATSGEMSQGGGYALCSVISQLSKRFPKPNSGQRQFF